jgi:hypothetical protein
MFTFHRKHWGNQKNIGASMLFSSLLMPKGALKDTTQLIHKFLWQGGNSNTKKFHLVNWNIVTSPKYSGGLE